MDAPKSISPENPLPETTTFAHESVTGRTLKGFFTWLFSLLIRSALWIQYSWSKMKDLSGTNYDLGTRHFRNGNLVDAGFRFRMVLKMMPDHAMAWHQLGRTYLRQGKIQKGCEALRRGLELGARPEESKFLLACADEAFPLAQAPVNVPLTLITEYFDFVAPAFETMQREQFNYKGPQHTYGTVFLHLDKNIQTLRVLDLGGAIGLVAEKFRPHALKIIGVDISRGMAALAQTARDPKENLIYDEYHTMDFRRYLKEHPQERFNLVIAEDVLANLGELQEVFQEISGILATQGLFAFSTEILPDPGYILVRRLARFGHSAEYIRRIAVAAGLKELTFREVELYPGHKVHQWVLQKA